MPHFKKRFPSIHLEAADLNGATVTIKIDSLSSTEIEGEGDKKQQKGVIHFVDKRTTKTTWVYPVTVGRCLRAMFGDNDDDWIGKRVTIRSEKVEAFGDMEDALRPVGSPDITEAVTFRVRKGRGKVKMTMVPTGKPGAKGQTDNGQTVPPPGDSQ